MAARVRLDRTAVDQMAEGGAAVGADRAARFMAGQMKATTRSRRIRDRVAYESGRDSRGWYARAGMPEGTQQSAGFFWYWEEYETGRASGRVPFLRQALWNNTGLIGRMMVRGR